MAKAATKEKKESKSAGAGSSGAGAKGTAIPRLQFKYEKEILPALRAGFIVLTDRYIYSLMARASVRGNDPEWLREVYGFALKPDAIFYLRLSVDDLVTRVLHSSGFDYWESGMDLHMGEDLYESFVRYQRWLLAEFDKMVEVYGFQIVDASRSIEDVFEDLHQRIGGVLNGH